MDIEVQKLSSKKPAHDVCPHSCSDVIITRHPAGVGSMGAYDAHTEYEDGWCIRLVSSDESTP